jgi:hypothetical protein
MFQLSLACALLMRVRSVIPQVQAIICFSCFKKTRFPFKPPGYVILGQGTDHHLLPEQRSEPKDRGEP